MCGAGKTSYIKKLLENAPKVFTETPSSVIYFYNVYQPKFAEMEDSIENISFFSTVYLNEGSWNSLQCRKGICCAFFMTFIKML